MRIKFYIFLFTLFLGLTVNSQELIFKNLQELDLPSFETYNVMQDSKGYIWISTDGGLCKYNGKSVKVFDKRKGIFEGSTYSVKEDKYGNIWCTTSQNRLLKIVNDSVTEAPMSKMFEAKLSKLHLNYFLLIEGDSIYTCSQTLSYYGSITSPTLALRQLKDPTSYYQLTECSGGLIPTKHSAFPKMMDPLRSGSICVFVNTSKGKKHLMIPYKTKTNPNWRVCSTKNNSGISYFSFDNYVVKVNQDLSFSYIQTKGEVISLYADKDDGLWAGTFKGGLYYFKNSNDITSPIHYMSDYSVSGICHDAEGGMWCTTLEKGVFYCKNKSILSYNTTGLDKRAGLLKSVNNTIYTSCVPNILFEVKEHRVKRLDLGSGGNYLLSDVIPLQNSWLISGRNFTLRANKNFGDKAFVISQTKKMVGSAQMSSTNEGRVFGISYGYLFELADQSISIILDPLESPGRSIVNSHNQLLVGLKNGLYKLDPDLKQLEKVNGINGELIRVLVTGESSVWICTKDNRLYHLDKNVVTNMTEKLKLPGTRFYDVAEDKFGTLWIASNVGLICINDQSGKTTISTYNSTHGLPSTIVYEVEATDSSIYVSTPEGLASFPLQAEISNFNPAQIYLNSLKVNDVERAWSSKMCFKHFDNSLKFSFDVLSFKGHVGPVMYYRLIGADDKIHTVDGRRIELNNTPPGKYRLEVYAYNNDGIAGKDPVVIEFEILKPFWKELWFIIVLILLMVLFVCLFAKRIANNFRKRETEKTRVHKLIAEYQLSALQAQMNPHFIFNAINSIQTYILENDTQLAYDYLAKFSKLVRMVLHNAKEKSISLEKEIELLTMYIELEQLRFENKFELSFNVQEGLDTYQVQLPPMLIQPYVENAIWHGLMPLESKRRGTLRVEMYEYQKEVHIIVEDNGIGREASMKIRKTPEHKSVAMELTKERLDVLKSIPGYESASIEVIDLRDDGDEANGTRVKIIIPLN